MITKQGRFARTHPYNKHPSTRSGQLRLRREGYDIILFERIPEKITRASDLHAFESAG